MGAKRLREKSDLLSIERPLPRFLQQRLCFCREFIRRARFIEPQHGGKMGVIGKGLLLRDNLLVCHRQPRRRKVLPSGVAVLMDRDGGAFDLGGLCGLGGSRRSGGVLHRRHSRHVFRGKHLAVEGAERQSTGRGSGLRPPCEAAALAPAPDDQTRNIQNFTGGVIARLIPVELVSQANVPRGGAIRREEGEQRLGIWRKRRRGHEGKGAWRLSQRG